MVIISFTPQEAVMIVVQPSIKCHYTEEQNRKLLLGSDTSFLFLVTERNWRFFRYDQKENKVSSLMTANIDGTDEKIIAAGSLSEYFRVWSTFPDWSPDDKKLVVSVTAKASGKDKKRRQELFCGNRCKNRQKKR